MVNGDYIDLNVNGKELASKICGLFLVKLPD